MKNSIKLFFLLILSILFVECSKDPIDSFVNNINNGKIESVRTDLNRTNGLSSKALKNNGKLIDTTSINLIFTTDTGEEIELFGILEFVDYQYDNYREVINFTEGISLVLFYSERYQDNPDRMLIKVDEINLLAEQGTYSSDGDTARFSGQLIRLEDDEELFLTYYWDCVGFGDGAVIPDTTTENLPPTGETIQGSVDVFNATYLTDDISDQLRRSIKDRFTGMPYYLDRDELGQVWTSNDFELYNFGYEGLYGGTLVVENWTRQELDGILTDWEIETIQTQWQINEDFMIEVEGEVYQIHLDGDPATCRTNEIVRIVGNNGELTILNMGYPPIDQFMD